MGLDIFFLEDIRNALLAVNEASSATAEAAGFANDGLRYYRLGYRNALAAVALVFGLPPGIVDGADAKEIGEEKSELQICSASRRIPCG